MKYQRVAIINSEAHYKLKVAVYRHATTPNLVTIHILGIYPIPPRELKVWEGDETAQIVEPGMPVTFDAKIYPSER